MYHYFIPNNNVLHLYSTFQLTECFHRYSFKVHMSEGGQWEDRSPLDMTPGREVNYILPLKVFFCAMPFPARQQGGLTGDYVSLPGYTETKQRVRQDHPPLTPLPPSAAFLPPTDSLSLCFGHSYNSQVPLLCSKILTFISYLYYCRFHQDTLGFLDPLSFASFIPSTVYPNPLRLISLFSFN